MPGVRACVLRGAKEIAAYVGINYQELCRYVEDEQLPAFKHPGSKTWVAFPADLKAWAWTQRQRFLKNKPGGDGYDM